MLLKAALNGNRTLQEHSNIPVSPKQLAADVELAVSQGVGAVHIHPRSKNGAESLKRSDIEPTVVAIRALCSAIPIGVSTGEWIEPHLDTRLRCISEWRELVDFASVNFSEHGAADVSHKLLELGIAVEAGLFHSDAAKALVNSGLAERCLRLMFEPEAETVSGAIQAVKDIEDVLAEHQVENASRLLHGRNLTTWPLLKEAKQRGYDTRIGFEDTLLLPNGYRAESNIELIEAAKNLLALT